MGGSELILAAIACGVMGVGVGAYLSPLLAGKPKKNQMMSADDFNKLKESLDVYKLDLNNKKQVDVINRLWWENDPIQLKLAFSTLRKKHSKMWSHFSLTHWQVENQILMFELLKDGTHFPETTHDNIPIVSLSFTDKGINRDLLKEFINRGGSINGYWSGFGSIEGFYRYHAQAYGIEKSILDSDLDFLKEIESPNSK